jgi:phosphoribosyl 1,2-cyclic phosphodiesterase
MGGRRVIFDLGTGVRNLGKWFMRKQLREATVLMSHTHWDHIQGFPFSSRPSRRAITSASWPGI